jgi:hypothetical protein
MAGYVGSSQALARRMQQEQRAFGPRALVNPNTEQGRQALQSQRAQGMIRSKAYINEHAERANPVASGFMKGLTQAQEAVMMPLAGLMGTAASGTPGGKILGALPGIYAASSKTNPYSQHYDPMYNASLGNVLGDVGMATAKEVGKAMASSAAPRMGGGFLDGMLADQRQAEKDRKALVFSTAGALAVAGGLGAAYLASRKLKGGARGLTPEARARMHANKAANPNAPRIKLVNGLPHVGGGWTDWEDWKAMGKRAAKNAAKNVGIAALTAAAGYGAYKGADAAVQAGAQAAGRHIAAKLKEGDAKRKFEAYKAADEARMRAYDQARFGSGGVARRRPLAPPRKPRAPRLHASLFSTGQ